jgi:anti-sigma-K factor RskA
MSQAAVEYERSEIIISISEANRTQGFWNFLESQRMWRYTAVAVVAVAAVANVGLLLITASF